MRWVFVLLLGSAAVQTAVPLGQALAQASSAETPASEPLAPPRGAEAQAYREAVAGAGLQDDLVYLPADVPLDADLAAPEAPEPSSWQGEGPGALTLTARIFLAALAVGLIVLVVHNHRLLGEFFGGRDRRFGARPGLPDATNEAGRLQIDHDLLARLHAEDDPRVGLRLLLKRFLALAALENRIVLRRSLTTRELLRVLPGGWRHRDDLEHLAGRVELTVFGGRQMSRETYQECLDLAEPLLFRLERRA